MTYVTDQQLRSYARLLVAYAAGGGEPPRPGSVIQLVVPEPAKPLLPYLLEEVLRAKAHPKTLFLPSCVDRVFFDHASTEQLRFFPEAYKRAEADLIDAQVSIIAEADPRELLGIDPAKVFLAADARRKQRDWLFDKELQGNFRWTLALFGTEAMAKEAGISLDAYWQQIVAACFLDAPDPIAEWKGVIAEIARIKRALNALAIASVHVEAEGIDLDLTIGAHRTWLGGSLRNIPSFEIFTSPDWRGTYGYIAFNQPLFRYGNVLRGIRLAFKDGLVTEATADVGADVLHAMLQRKNANRLGEFSLTDKRFSRITTFMANTLYDENMGGKFGNTHVALGRAYRDAYDADPRPLTQKDWDDLGYNDSPEHTDIISTTDRIVTARLADGSSRVIFKDGMFQV